MLKHTWAATLRWDWPSNSRAEDLKPLLPPYLFLFFIEFSGIFLFLSLFLSIFQGEFLLISGTRWHYPRAGWKSDPTSLVWRDSDFKNNPSDYHSSPSSVSPIPAQTCLVLLFFFSIFFFFCLSYILCFCCKWISVFFCSSVCEKWMDLLSQLMTNEQHQ